MFIRSTLAVALLAVSAAASAPDANRPNFRGSDAEVWIDSPGGPVLDSPRSERQTAATRAAADNSVRRLVAPEPAPREPAASRKSAVRVTEPKEPSLAPVRTASLTAPAPTTAQHSRIGSRVAAIPKSVPSPIAPDAAYDPIPAPVPVAPREPAGTVAASEPSHGVPCDQCAECGSTPCHDWWCPPCNMVPHLPYRPPLHGYYYFRPYHPMHVRPQQAFVTGFGGDPRAPYANEVFQRVYANYGPAKKLTPPEEPKPPQPQPPSPPAKLELPPAKVEPKAQPKAPALSPLEQEPGALFKVEPKGTELPKVKTAPNTGKVPVPPPPAFRPASPAPVKE